MSKTLEVEFIIRNSFCLKCKQGTTNFSELDIFMKNHKQHYDEIEFDATIKDYPVPVIVRFFKKDWCGKLLAYAGNNEVECNLPKGHQGSCKHEF